MWNNLPFFHLCFVSSLSNRVLNLMGGYVAAPLEKDPMADSLDDTIRENAQGPAKASGDSGSMEQHKLPDQIAADRYLASKTASKLKNSLPAIPDRLRGSATSHVLFEVRRSETLSKSQKT